jgi:dUTP pyrophosphatase
MPVVKILSAEFKTYERQGYNMHLKIKPLNDAARETYSDHGHFHEGDAGLDLYVLEDITIEPGETKAIKLGIACEPKDGRAYFLMPRSSISKTPLRLANSIGLIDGGYRGELMAMCDNIKDASYTAEKGQRLFQVVACDCTPIYYEMVEELSDTTRGTGGFGSTGK